MPASQQANAYEVNAIGYQWWFRFEYPTEQATVQGNQKMPLVAANELVIPAGRPVRVNLRTTDVIHSFWIPKLAGKVDMVPGRAQQKLGLQAAIAQRVELAVSREIDGQLAGVYTGRPALFRPAELFVHPRADRTLIVDVFKELPIGNTREWLPRALEHDGLDSRVVLETFQARVVEVSTR